MIRINVLSEYTFCQEYNALYLFYFDKIVASKLREFSVKPFQFKSNFLSSCANNRFQGTVWVVFHGISKALFSAYLSYLPLSISQQNCRKFSEKSGIFSVLLNFVCYGLRLKAILVYYFDYCLSCFLGFISCI